MANDCDRPKKEDTPTGGQDPNGGKGKPKGGKDGRGNQIINNVGDTPDANLPEKN